MRPGLVAAATYVACLGGAAAASSSVTPSVVLPLTRRAPPAFFHRAGTPRLHRLRHLSEASALPLSGSTHGTGVFTVPLALGSPPQTLDTIVDTGSSLTAFTCAGCALGECGTSHGVFDPDASSTAVRLACTDAACVCGSPACTCGLDGACAYRRVYAESSSTSGVMVADGLALPPGLAPGAGAGNATARMVFGCATRETGSIHTQPAAGIAGLGADAAGLVDQLAPSGAIPGRAFALCLAPPPPPTATMASDDQAAGSRAAAGAAGGALLLGLGMPPGLEAVPGTVTTPLVRRAGGTSSYYTVRLRALALGGPGAPPLDTAPVPQPDVWAAGHGVVLDSGTTFTYLPRPAHAAFVRAVGGAAAEAGLSRVPGPDPAWKDVCWSGGGGGGGGSGGSSADTTASFPDMTLVFDGGGPASAPGAALSLPPRNYVFPHPSRRGAVCLGVFDNGDAGTILGGIAFLDTLVQIDRSSDAAGLGVARFVPGVDCGAVGRGAVAGLAGAGVPAPPPPPPPPPPPAVREAAATTATPGPRSRVAAWVAVLASVAALVAAGAGVLLLASRWADRSGGGEGGEGAAAAGGRSSCWPRSRRQWEAFEEGTATGALGLAAPVGGAAVAGVGAPAAAPPPQPPRPVVVELTDQKE